MAQPVHIAIDIGAESGKIIAGYIRENILATREIHRFPVKTIEQDGHICWNIHSLLEEIISGLESVALMKSLKPLSIGIDSWGVDFALLDEKGKFTSLPVSYRDKRTNGMMEAFFDIMPKERIYELSGIQFLQINSLFQLYSLHLNDPYQLTKARDILFIPDLFNYLLSGKKTTEFTFATTTQLFNPLKNNWEPELYERLNISEDFFPAVGQAGTFIGETLHKHFAGIPVVSVLSHDTASAVAAIPAIGQNWVFISSGTWSLMGFESAEPLINSDTYRMNFTNEGGIGHSFRILKNIMGLWLLQQCKKEWDIKHPLGYHELPALAATAKEFETMLDPDDPLFLNPDNMFRAIREFCLKTNQNPPENIASTVRCILESLALKYRFVLDQIRQISPHPVDKIHIIGGGSKNELLCRFTANACGIPVFAGPAECTADGNLLVQLQAFNPSLTTANLREIMINSAEIKVWEPEDAARWESAYSRFKELINHTL